MARLMIVLERTLPGVGRPGFAVLVGEVVEDGFVRHDGVLR